MTIGRLLASRDVAIVTCPEDARVADAAAILAERRIGALPVVSGQDAEGSRVLGIFSERDLLYQIAAAGAAALDRPVSEVMTAPAVSVTSETTVLAALSLMTRRRIRHLPVIDDRRMVGFVSIGDLVKLRIERIEAEAEAMRSYIQTA